MLEVIIIYDERDYRQIAPFFDALLIYHYSTARFKCPRVKSPEGGVVLPLRADTAAETILDTSASVSHVNESVQHDALTSDAASSMYVGTQFSMRVIQP